MCFGSWERSPQGFPRSLDPVHRIRRTGRLAALFLTCEGAAREQTAWPRLRGETPKFMRGSRLALLLRRNPSN